MQRIGRRTAGRKMRRRSKWALMLGTALAASATTQAATTSGRVESQGTPQGTGAAKDSRVLQFQIPAGPLDAAIAEYQRVTGIKVELADPRMGTVQSPSAVGGLTPAMAMDTLLSGTSVRATFGLDTVRLDIRGVSEFIAVEG